MSNAIVMVERNIRLSTRNVEALLTAVMLPILILVLFVYLFGGAIQTGFTDYVDYALPGVLLLCTGFVSALTATRVSEDLQEGIVDRFRSLGVGGAAMLGGHVAGSVLRNAVSITLLIAVALLIGFSPNASAAEWLLALGVLLLFVFAISWLAAVFGLLAKTPEGAAGFQFFIMFLPYPSSAFVPVETMPTWLHWFAENQPATPVIETVRGLLLGTPIGLSGVLAVAWCAGIAGVSMLLAALLFRRRVR
ncbi:ABC transporter permease [Hoyosella sp. YIM 151337]|uniref:ABC transporter permease n=1 Tax=Hoyosella sp. YIM 151337 TaxID=2992742 RepID=UPI002236550C|nr:ABC transporter permease [Hoyosella sp. YIM 151337]MCW4356052.1 ABC transporter permease [Hoyosella sp. YIM 151337]